MTTITRDHPALRLSLLPRPFFVRQSPNVPHDALSALSTDPHPRFLSVTRTAEEWSVVGECADDADPGAKWRCIKVAGPMDFGASRRRRRRGACDGLIGKRVGCMQIGRAHV